MSDLVASWLRTVVPGLYAAAIGSVLAWLAAHSPWVLDLLELLNIDPQSTAFVAGIVTLVLAGWYAGWRKLEPYIPDWLTRLVLGSAKAPTYAPVTADGVHVITNIVDTTALPGYEVPEVSDAKTEVADVLNQEHDGDNIATAETAVERLLAMGWRPTR